MRAYKKALEEQKQKVMDKYGISENKRAKRGSQPNKVIQAKEKQFDKAEKEEKK